jgi:putative glutathione S-transferase
VLWDKQEGVIVNNESSDILRMFNASFNNLAKNPELDLYPENLRAKIDEVGLFHATDCCILPSGAVNCASPLTAGISDALTAQDLCHRLYCCVLQWLLHFYRFPGQ